MSRGNHFAILMGAVGSERSLAARLKGDGRVVWAEPDFLRKPHQIRPEVWAFQNLGNRSVLYTRGRYKGLPVESYPPLPGADIGILEGAWGFGGSVAIASIDTGVQFGHSEFLPFNVLPAYDFYDGDADPSDTDGHGTHTTGTMVGQTVGVAGVAGAASKVTVYVYRVCGPQGCPASAIADAINAAAGQGVVAMNLSLGGSSISQAEIDAIAAAVSEDGTPSLVIASAGNGGTGTVSCPACDPNAISVAASNWQDELAYYSNWGPGLDITAPGGELFSNTTDEAGIFSSVPGGGYAYYQGTSMAAPMVTGAAAVVASVKAWTGDDLRNALLTGADDLGDITGYDEEYGYGRLNVQGALNWSGGEPPPPPTEELTAAFTTSCKKAECTFDASTSAGDITGYEWWVDGGEAGTGVTTEWVFTDPGTYPVTLTVSAGTEDDTITQEVSCQTAGRNLKCG
jgi:serine protease